MRMQIILLFVGLAASCASATVFAAAPAKMPDALEVLSPAAIRIDGWLGARIDANEAQRLLQVDTVPLLAGFHKKPGSHPWIGEHVGKWLHAATLAWVYSGDQALGAKIDRVAAELIACQEADGYLGTYVPEKRFGLYPEADWDVWSHKYNLLGLLTYYHYTGDKAALAACCKIGDLLIRTFPARKSILAAGTHMGMAATSVLEPTVLLYRESGDARYLDFARYIVKSWDEPGGPAIIASLLTRKAVNKTANGKAYEMLSNLVGLCELTRATGEREFLQPVLIAWDDITRNRLYLTGSASNGEHFQGDHVLPNEPRANLCETCVTVTWIQLNWQLLRLTGEAKFGDELERTLYNHLAAAQHPRGADWCYFTALEGKKPYDSGINCCHSSGPRGMALAPLAAYLKGRVNGQDALAVSTLETSHCTLELSGRLVLVQQKSEFPRRGSSLLTFRLAAPATFALRVRVPAWAAPLRMEIGSQAVGATSDGWATIAPRRWKDGDRVALEFNLSGRAIRGEYGNAGRTALAWGPFVLACDENRTPGLPGLDRLTLSDAQLPLALAAGSGLAFEADVRAPGDAAPRKATLVPFADAGASGGTYRVWLRTAEK